MSERVLITMDDLEVAVRSNGAFEEAGFETKLVSALDNHRSMLRKSPPDLAVLTGGLHEKSAREIIELARDSDIPTLGVMEPTDPDPARYAAKLGLTAWIAKPADVAEIVSLGDSLIARRDLQVRTGILGESPAIQEVLVKIGQMAPAPSTVLVEGESGTGKELVAKAIHDLSPRRERSFIAVSCAALPESLLESELFGHEKGAFTGAVERRLGRFELAQNGTIFLDEVGEMALSVQVKLLRVLEARSFFRVGGTEAIKVDVRIIAATNQTLKEQVALGRFRDDLYYRLNVLSIYMPPLRERRSDIPILVRRFIRQLSEVHNKSFKGITAEAMQILVNAHWPGNVRQLRNLVESMVVLAPGREIGAADIPPDLREQGTRLLPVRLPIAEAGARGGGRELEFIFKSLVELKMQIEELRRRMDVSPPRLPAEAVEIIDVRSTRDLVDDGEVVATPMDLSGDFALDESDGGTAVIYRDGMTMADVERAAIEAVLRDTNGNRRRAAERLGIGERTLYRKIKEFQLA